MNPQFKEAILNITAAKDTAELEEIQELWSGFGQIVRVYLKGANVSSVIVKNIDLSNGGSHPRGWNTAASFNRKQISYEVEQEWYENYACETNDNCRTANYLGSGSVDGNRIIVLEDLDASGFPIRKSRLDKDGAKLCLKWLANFHAVFMNRPPEKLWEIGTYWHLATRSEEYRSMEESELKNHAFRIDEILNSCQFKTFVHGDAKVANFCFSEDGKNVSAVDFQYVGSGCGMKDVAYFLGSCLTEIECKDWEAELLDFYFESLKIALELNKNGGDIESIEIEWRMLYSVAWADFTRFLLGWTPSHNKINSYSTEMVNTTLSRF